MKIEQQVVSLKLAQKLKKMEVKQESLFYWIKDDLNDTYLAVDWYMPLVQAGYNRVPIQSLATDFGWRENIEKYSAFTVAELGEMLKDGGATSFFKGKWVCTYDHQYSSVYKEVANTEVDARAKMLVYLLENKLITL